MPWMGNGLRGVCGAARERPRVPSFGRNEPNSQLSLSLRQGVSPHSPPVLQHEPRPPPGISSTAVAPGAVACSGTLSRSPEAVASRCRPCALEEGQAPARPSHRFPKRSPGFCKARPMTSRGMKW